jgi:protease IV
MKQFFKFLLSSFLGTFLALFLIFLIMIGIFSALIPEKESIAAKANTILKIELNTPVLDRSPSNPFENFNFGSLENIKTLGLNDILKNLKKASKDENVIGIYLRIDQVEAGMATLTEIRDALIEFKESGKFIYSYGDYYSQKAYYLASVSDKIFINPQGLIEFLGLRTELLFFKNALDKYGIEPQIIRGSGNKFKSAVEPFMYDRMSDANRLQTETYLNSMWGKITADISASRNIPEAELNRLATDMLVRNAKSSLEYQLTDSILFEDQVLSLLNEKSGIETEKEPNFMSLSEYFNTPETNREGKGLAKDKIAVIYASGEIVDGKGSDGTVASETMAQAIREVRRDSSIKAVVLRVNSPGGSALASDIILRELNLTKEQKPLIVSMGDVAASGGYYIACQADSILASENTITGSIGVFGLFFNISNFLDQRIGIDIDRVKTNEHADLGSMTRNLTDLEKSVIQQSVDEIYSSFINYVAQGRAMEVAMVDSIGQGRVWSGENALQIGLIDSYGGLSKAIEIAANKAGLSYYRTVDYPKQKDPFEMVMESLEMKVSTYFLKNKMGENYHYLEFVQKQIDNQGIRARLPYDIQVN